MTPIQEERVLRRLENELQIRLHDVNFLQSINVAPALRHHTSVEWYNGGTVTGRMSGGGHISEIEKYEHIILIERKD
jgi:hypothetical protein